MVIWLFARMPRYLCHLLPGSGDLRGGESGLECRGQEGREAPWSPGEPQFTPVAIETLGAIGPRSMLFLRDLGRRIALESGEPRSTDYLLQRLSVAVQRGNAASVRGGMGP